MKFDDASRTCVIPLMFWLMDPHSNSRIGPATGYPLSVLFAMRQ
jgi:hypothetical protein